jgi:DNA-binding transcriptional ArsR family regulator
MVNYSRSRGGLDALFGALADPTRRAVLARLRQGDHSIGELARPFGMSLPGFMKHLAILEDAGLIERHKVGRVVNCRLQAGALKAALEWLERYEQFWTARLDRLGAHLERKESDAWTPHSTKAPALKSAASSKPPSPRSTPRGRSRKR